MLEGELRHEIHALCGEEVALPMQYEVLRLLNLHHMVFVVVARGAGEGRSASLCVWLVAAADKRSAVARLYKSGELAFSPVRISPLDLSNKHLLPYASIIVSQRRDQEICSSVVERSIVRF